MYAFCLWGMDPPLPLLCFCGNLMASTQDRRPWIWIYPWISTQKSVDMVFGYGWKFRIHDKPGPGTRIYIGLSIKTIGLLQTKSRVRKGMVPQTILHVLAF